MSLFYPLALFPFQRPVIFPFLFSLISWQRESQSLSWMRSQLANWHAKRNEDMRQVKTPVATKLLFARNKRCRTSESFSRLGRSAIHPDESSSKNAWTHQIIRSEILNLLIFYLTTSINLYNANHDNYHRVCGPLKLRLREWLFYYTKFWSLSSTSRGILCFYKAHHMSISYPLALFP